MTLSQVALSAPGGIPRIPNLGLFGVLRPPLPSPSRYFLQESRRGINACEFPLSVTGFAVSPVPAPFNQVADRILMAGRAVCPRLPEDPTLIGSILQIVGTRADKEMGGIYTSPNVTAVQHEEPYRDCPVVQLPRNPMRPYVTDLPVITVGTTTEQPAPRPERRVDRAFPVYLLPKPIGKGSLLVGSGHKRYYTTIRAMVPDIFKPLPQYDAPEGGE